MYTAYSCETIWVELECIDAIIMLRAIYFINCESSFNISMQQ